MLKTIFRSTDGLTGHEADVAVYNRYYRYEGLGVIALPYAPPQMHAKAVISRSNICYGFIYACKIRSDSDRVFCNPPLKSESGHSGK
jgi:hypothetical protein